MRSRFFFLGLFLVSIGIPVAFVFYPSYQVISIIQFVPSYTLDASSVQRVILIIIGSIMSTIIGLGFIVYSLFSKPTIKEFKVQSMNNYSQERNQAQVNKEVNYKGIKNILGEIFNFIIGFIIIIVGYYVNSLNLITNNYIYLLGIGIWILVGILWLIYGIYSIIHKLRMHTF